MSTLLYSLATMTIFQVSPTVTFWECFMQLLCSQLCCWYGPQYKQFQYKPRTKYAQSW